MINSSARSPHESPKPRDPMIARVSPASLVERAPSSIAAASLDRARPRDHLVERGLAYLAAAHDGRGIQSDLSTDASFRERFALAGLRAVVRQRTGVDLGFDPGTETFSSMVAARLLCRRLPDHPLPRALASTFATCHFERRFRFFHGPGLFAADTDCTGVALTALAGTGLLTRGALEEGVVQILGAVPSREILARQPELEAGVPMVYWDDGREPGVAPRGFKQDPCVAANALYALAIAEAKGCRTEGLRRVIDATTAYLDDLLDSGAWRARTRYYPTPDALLCFVGEACAASPALRLALGRSLRRAVSERIAEAGDDDDAAIHLGMRLLAAATIGLDDPLSARKLSRGQDDRGVFAAGPFFSLGRLPGIYFGSEALTTAVVVAALLARGAAVR